MLKPALEMRARQQMSLSPRLQQSVRLLQMSAAEFAQEIRQAIANNPFLEEDESRSSEDGERESLVGELSAHDEVEPYEVTRHNDEVDGAEHDLLVSAADQVEQFDSDLNQLIGSEGQDSSRRLGTDAGDAHDWLQDTPSIREHLILGLRDYRLSDRDRLLALTIINALDDDGYLREDLDTLAQMLRQHPPVEPSEMRMALKLIQHLDPPGVGARSLQECLALQLVSVDQRAPGFAHAKSIVADHLVLLAQGNVEGLQRALKCDSGELQLAIHLIRRLNPRPGSRFAQERTQFVIPDVMVRKQRDDWIAIINPAVLPRTRIHTTYAEMFRRSRDIHGHEMSRQLQEARWLIRNTEQRFMTIQRVAQVIVNYQRTFFDYGEIALKPMTLHDVAIELRMHESTVSRATGNKFMATPRGIFEFRHFFSRQFATSSGGSCSAAAVRALMKEFLHAERPESPWSDVELARLLEAQGIKVARRTIAKYRQILNVPAAEIRRRNALTLR